MHSRFSSLLSGLRLSPLLSLCVFLGLLSPLSLPPFLSSPSLSLSRVVVLLKLILQRSSTNLAEILAIVTLHLFGYTRLLRRGAPTAASELHRIKIGGGGVPPP